MLFVQSRSVDSLRAMRHAVLPAVVALLAVLLVGATAWATSDIISTCVDGVGFGYCKDEKSYVWNAEVTIAAVAGALAVLASIVWQRRRGAR